MRENDENLAKLLLQRTVNQAWKTRFAEMMDSLDAKDLVRTAMNCVQTRVTHFSNVSLCSDFQAKRTREKAKFMRQYIRKAQEVYDLGCNKFADVLHAHSPALVDLGCAGHLKRLWNNLLVSGNVLNQLVNDCERFVLVYHCKKIQKQWRTVRIRRHFEAVLSKSKYMSGLTQKGKLWKAQNGFDLSITGRRVSHVLAIVFNLNL
jgi:hypothetical protein